MKVQITEYLDIDLEKEMWCCNRCGRELISARAPYKKGCLVCEKPATDIYEPLLEDSPYSFSPNPDYCRIVEFYCPGCGIMIENEYLPPGHPITVDIELDVDTLKDKYLKVKQ